MTILVDYEIESAVKDGSLVITPFDEKRLQPNSYDLCLSEEFAWYEGTGSEINPFEPSSVEGVISCTTKAIYLDPGDFVLGATVEKFTLPRDIVGQINGKSSLARLGLMVHITAGFIDAGFSTPPASITLEIVNLGKRSIELTAGMAIAQIVFTRTAPCRTSYSEKKDAKYLGQKNAASSQYYKNKLL